MVDWTDKKRGLIGTPTYPSRTNSLSFNTGQRENLGGLSQSQSFEGSVRIKRFGMYEQIFDYGAANAPTTNCCNVSELATSPMKCGTTQQLGIVSDYDRLGITSACAATRYRWTLALAPGGRYSENGVGGLDTTIITNPIYTAPACEQEGSPVLQTTVRISLFCNDVLADYMDIEIRTAICCPKKIVYETLTMWCGESQTLSPEDFSLDCLPSLYTWEIEEGGGGSFDEQGTGDYTITYNAPECGAYCVNEVVINLYCDDPEHVFPPCDSITITIYPCPKNASITYTTQQMAVSEQQSLGIDKYEGQCGTGASWLWEILSGGGSLSDPTSSSGCTYTAPSSNANCEQNPTIALSCDGVVMDTLDIAVNGNSSGGEAYYVANAPFPGAQCYWYITADSYSCSGEYIASRDCANCGGFTACGCAMDLCYTPGDPGNCIGDNSPCAGSRICDAAGVLSRCTTCGTVNGVSIGCLGKTEVRTVAMKTAGCCPSELL
jgi:hypothetical protein